MTTTPAGDFAQILHAGMTGAATAPPAPDDGAGPRLPAPNPAQGSGGGVPIPDPDAAQKAFEERFAEILNQNVLRDGWTPLDPA